MRRTRCIAGDRWAVTQEGKRYQIVHRNQSGRPGIRILYNN
jgi:hypothetical protein